MKETKNYYFEALLCILSFVISFYLVSKFYVWVYFVIPMPYSDIYGYDEYKATSIVLGIISILTCWYLTRTYFLKKDKKKIWYYPYLAVAVSLILHGLFFAIETEYTFKEHPRWFMYMDSRGEYIEHPQYYFWLIDRLGFHGETYRPFETLDEAIQGLEYAKEKKNGLYGYIFRDLEKFGYEEVFKKYDDEYFQLYFASEMMWDLLHRGEGLFKRNIDLMIKFTSYIKNREVQKLYIGIYDGYNGLINKNPDYNEPLIEYRKNNESKIDSLFTQLTF